MHKKFLQKKVLTKTKNSVVGKKFLTKKNSVVKKNLKLVMKKKKFLRKVSLKSMVLNTLLL